MWLLGKAAKKNVRDKVIQGVDVLNSRVSSKLYALKVGTVRQLLHDFVVDVGQVDEINIHQRFAGSLNQNEHCAIGPSPLSPFTPSPLAQIHKLSTNYLKKTPNFLEKKGFVPRRRTCNSCTNSEQELKLCPRNIKVVKGAEVKGNKAEQEDNAFAAPLR